MFLNASGALPCLNLPSDVEEDGIWDYQWCTEMLPQVRYFQLKESLSALLLPYHFGCLGPMPLQESYFARDGVHDMFWQENFSLPDIAAHCLDKYGIRPRPDWIKVQYGGRSLSSASNIVFTNGLLDPWSSGGVMANVSGTAVAVVLPNGAHHLDLFFSDPRDPPDVVRARALQREHIARWCDASHDTAADRQTALSGSSLSR